MLVSNEGGKLSAYCFRCHESGWAEPPAVSLAERTAALAGWAQADRAALSLEVPATNRQSMSYRADLLQLPSPGLQEVSDWPAAAKLWLFKAGLGRPEIARLGAFFSPAMQRVVLPVYEAHKLVFWQARAYQPGRNPKYIAPPVDRTKVVPRYGTAEDVTLTEDILSAFKVGLVGEGWAMMGTSMNVGLIANLMARRPRRVNVWLDSDGPGTTASRKVLAKLRSLGIECRGVTTDEDPKLNSRSTIKELLS